MYNELREMRQQIYSLPKENRDVAKGILVYKKITTLERLDDMYAAGRSFINQYHKNWNEDKNAMKAIDKLKNYLNKENENSISGAEIELSLEKAVQAQKRLQELQQTNTRLKDLVMDKQETKIVYRDQKQSPPYLLIRVILLLPERILLKKRSASCWSIRRRSLAVCSNLPEAKSLRKNALL